MQTKHDLEQDLHRSPVILEKVKLDSYAQNLYAAMCNMQWQYLGSEWALTAGDLAALALADVWHCSWRYSGGIVADLRGEGDYMDWYCSGMGGFSALADETAEETARWIKEKGYVAESVVTDEIRKDLAELGWHPVPWDNDEDTL